MRPDRFARVLCFLGSFPQVAGVNRYPELIRGTPRKPLRVFLQAATHDLNWGSERNWLSANLQVAAALAERDYDLRVVLGDGGHDLNHCGVILPDALRWPWRNPKGLTLGVGWAGHVLGRRSVTTVPQSGGEPAG